MIWVTRFSDRTLKIVHLQNLAVNHCVTIRIQNWICDLKHTILKDVAFKKLFGKKTNKQHKYIFFLGHCVMNLWDESTLNFTLPLSATQLNDYPHNDLLHFDEVGCHLFKETSPAVLLRTAQFRKQQTEPIHVA